MSGRKLAIQVVEGDATGSPAFERLVSLLATATHFHVSHGERWPSLTPEQRAEAIVGALDDAREAPGRTSPPQSRRPKVDVQEWLGKIRAVREGEDG